MNLSTSRISAILMGATLSLLTACAVLPSALSAPRTSAPTEAAQNAPTSVAEATQTLSPSISQAQANTFAVSALAALGIHTQTQWNALTSAQQTADTNSVIATVEGQGATPAQAQQSVPNAVFVLSFDLKPGDPNK